MSILLLAVQACNPTTTTPTEDFSMGITNTPTAEASDTPIPHPTETPVPPPSETPESPPSETAVSTPPVISSPALVSISMKDETTGWGLTDQYILRSTDGGLTWNNLTPEGGFAPGSTLSGFFLDAGSAWVLVPNPDFESGTVYRSVDAGQTWESAPAPFANARFQFLDAQTGWALVGTGAAAGSSAVDIYKTLDGGLTWEKIYGIDPQDPDQTGDLPFTGSKNGLTFRDETHGWVGGTQPQDGYVWLFRTQDGGQTWQQQDIPIPEPYQSSILSIDAPVFFGDQEGVLPVTFFAETTAMDFYVTQDGGETWTSTTPVELLGRYDLASQQDFQVWDGGAAFASTQDGGQNWTEITPNIDLTDTLVQIDFVSSSTGWALASDASGEVQLYLTEDGGATWSPLFP